MKRIVHQSILIHHLGDHRYRHLDQLHHKGSQVQLLYFAHQCELVSQYLRHCLMECLKQMSYLFHMHLRTRHPIRRYHYPLDMYHRRLEYRLRRHQNLHCYRYHRHLYPTILRNLEVPSHLHLRIHHHHRQYQHYRQYHHCQYL